MLLIPSEVILYYWTYSFIVVPEYVRWWLRTMQHDASQIDSASTIYEEIWTSDYLGRRLWKHVFM